MAATTTSTSTSDTTPGAHDLRVSAIAEALAARSTAEGPAHIDKGGVHHVVPLPGDRRFASAPIDTSSLRNILSVDPESRTCVCEPGVTFAELVAATLPHGLAPAVVPELSGITVGGAVAGCSVESMSFRYGGFHDMCLAYEVIGGDGTVHQLSETSEPELFHHVHGSYGTLGILASVTFRLVPAGRYVNMEYRSFTRFDEYEVALNEACRIDGDAAHDLVDGIVFGPDHLVLCLGTFTDDPGDRTPSDYTGENIYYRSAARRSFDLMTAEDYFFRYDTECHWLTATVPPLEWKWFRRLFGRHVLGSTNLIRWANRAGRAQRLVSRRPDVVCDIFFPMRRLSEFWEWYGRVYDFWPLWIVPYRPPSLYPWLGRAITDGADDGEMLVDCAVYGKRNNERHRDYSQLLEEETFELGGIKTLIGRNHYSRDRFWEIYDRDRYVAAKAKLDPTGTFPDLYDKLGRVE